ncbi:MAG: methylated-DNA--[protein]-cysteine S-methyltransferase [Nitriliruptor sp.]
MSPQTATDLTIATDRVHTTIESPIGPLRLVATERVLSGLYMDAQRHLPDEASFGRPDPAPFADAALQLTEYFAGERTRFDLPLHLDGTDFQRRVWGALCDIPYGQTWSYGQLAEHIGSPGASRAVGLANGRNPISVIVPCHRVVGADGKLTGYGGGVERKQLLLDLERDRRGDRLF